MTNANMSERDHEAASEAVDDAVQEAMREPQTADQPTLPTPQEIASMAAEAVRDCERAASSLESLGNTAQAIATALLVQCQGAAQVVRQRGGDVAKGVTTFAEFAAEQAEAARRMAEQVETILPRPAKPAAAAVRPPEADEYGARDAGKLSFLKRGPRR